MKKRLCLTLRDMRLPYRSSCDYNDLIEEKYYNACIHEDEYSNIYLNHKIKDKEFTHALRIILTRLMQKEANYIMIDLNEFDNGLSPVKEMTLEEIEKKLGHKVKIVKEKEE